MTSIRGPRRGRLLIFVRRCLTASCVAALLSLLPNGTKVSAQTAAPTVQTVLKQRIIRSLAVHPTEVGRILVGNKGSSPGSGLVFESRDNGKSWRFLNGGKPVDPAATDVQAVAYGTKGTVFAGTWKHGLYVSRDGGETYARLRRFPASDIRDIRVATEKPSIVYAATPGQGVFKSGDGGATWSAIGPSNVFFWSLHVSASGDQVYAVSLEKAVYWSRDGGKSWRKIFDRENAYAIAVTAESGLWLATEKGLYRAAKPDAPWRLVETVPRGKFSAVAPSPDGRSVLLGDWSGGVHMLDVAGNSVGRLVPKRSVVHLRWSGSKLLAGSWGDGLALIDRR